MNPATKKNGRLGNKPGTQARRLFNLYEKDEAAWLEKSVALIEQGRLEEMDYEHLAEFLQDMAISQKREVKSRLRTLLQHLLKWIYQPANRGPSWRKTIREQRRELNDIFESKSLRRYGEQILEEAYQDAVVDAADETRLKESKFPKSCPFSLEEAISLKNLDEPSV